MIVIRCVCVPVIISCAFLPVLSEYGVRVPV